MTYAALCLLLAAAATFAADIRLTLEGFTSAEENVILFAVNGWETRIDGSALLQIEIRKTHYAGDVNAATDEFRTDAAGIPSHARISIADRVGEIIPWFIDPTPQLNEEFSPGPVPNSWNAIAGSPASDSYDLLTVVNHELAHAFGFSTFYPLFAAHVQTQADSIPYYVGNGNDIVVPLTPAFLGTHIQESLFGPDLMNSLLLPGWRFAPSYYDLAVLNDAFGYDNPVSPPPATISEPGSLSFTCLAVPATILFFELTRRHSSQPRVLEASG
jgi:hypothetical protein